MFIFLKLNVSVNTLFGKKMSNVKYYLLSMFLLNYLCTQPLSNGGITGIISDKISGEPLAGVSIVIAEAGLSKVSGSDGRYEFIELEPNQYNIQVSMAGYKYNVRRAEVRSGDITKCDIQLEPLKTNEPETTNSNLPAKFPLTGVFLPKDNAVPYPHFVLANPTLNTVSNINIIIQTGDASGSLSAELKPSQTYTITNSYRDQWYQGDKLTVVTEGLTNVWIYSQ